MALKPAYPGEEAMAAAPADDQSAAPEKDGYVIEIACHGDGTFTVSVEGGDDEAAEESGSGEPGEMGGEAAEPAGTECKSVKAALTLALEITRNNGRMPGGADDDFQSGFGDSNA